MIEVIVIRLIYFIRYCLHFQIFVADINDNCPILPDVSFSKYPIPPLQIPPIIKISATDNDSGNNGKITYQSSAVISST